MVKLGFLPLTFQRHRGLIYTLKSYGISGKLLNLLSSFLSERQISVVLTKVSRRALSWARHYFYYLSMTCLPDSHVVSVVPAKPVCKPCIYRVCSSCVYCLCQSYQYTVSKRVINNALRFINIHDAMVLSFISFWASPVIVISPIM